MIRHIGATGALALVTAGHLRGRWASGEGAKKKGDGRGGAAGTKRRRVDRPTRSPRRDDSDRPGGPGPGGGCAARPMDHGGPVRAEAGASERAPAEPRAVAAVAAVMGVRAGAYLSIVRRAKRRVLSGMKGARLG